MPVFALQAQACHQLRQPNNTFDLSCSFAKEHQVSALLASCCVHRAENGYPPNLMRTNLTEGRGHNHLCFTYIPLQEPCRYGWGMLAERRPTQASLEVAIWKSPSGALGQVVQQCLRQGFRQLPSLVCHCSCFSSTWVRVSRHSMSITSSRRRQ